MKFPVACCDCRYVNHFEWSQVGQKLECDGCGTPLTVPAPMETIADDTAPPPRALKFRCPSCRRKFATKPDMAGQKIRCTGCGAGVRVPWAEEPAETPSSQLGVAAFALSDELKTVPEPRRVDPVRADVPRLDVGAVASQANEKRQSSDRRPGITAPELDSIASLDGIQQIRRPETFLTSRAAMMEFSRQQSAQDEAVEARQTAAKASGKGKGKRKKKKKHSSFFDPQETLKLVAGVGAFVALVAFLAWGYPGLRFPLGGSLCLVGFIVYAIGAYSLRQVVAEEGMIKLIAFRLCPPYQWWFVATRWQETRDFFAFFLAGAIVMSLGGAIIKVSPTGRKAEANEEAYQKLVNRKPAEAPASVTIGSAGDRE
jgi:hypothetical protein